MRCIIVYFALVLGIGGNRVQYNGFKVYQVLPTTKTQFDLVDTLKKNDDYDFWSRGRAINSVVKVMVGPNKQANFEKILSDNKLTYSTIIKDVERIIKIEKLAQYDGTATLEGDITFTKYHRYEEIQKYLKNLQDKYPATVKLHNPGKSVLGRDLTVIQISTDPAANKPVFFIDGGIHGREWIAPATVLYIIKQLVENTENKYLLEKVDWHILPLLNPDGYEHSQESDRLWRKNRATTSAPNCLGVDLNRNFGDHWGGEGTSNNPCSEIYRGPAAFSEPEAQALRDYLLSIKDKTKLYLTVHSFGQYILHPWGWGNAIPPDSPELLRLGKLVAESIRKVNDTEYEVGTITNFADAGAGGSDDWAKSGAGIKYCYTLELPGGGETGFDLPPDEIQNVVAETFPGIVTFYNELK